MRLIISSAARRDLAAIGDWIARDNPQRALTFTNELEAACLDLLDYPLAYPLWEGSRDRPIRKRTYGHYLILYETGSAAVRIVAVVHGRRDATRLV